MKESQVFTGALRFATPADRSAYLDAVCAGDPTLRAEVEALLQAQASDPDFLEAPPGPLGSIEKPPPDEWRPNDPTKACGTEQPGVLLGDKYKLLEPIGEGGMATVWMAQQTKPVRRLVAVKLIQPGRDSKQVLARFDAERQALALMDHPNIAKVFDAGSTEGVSGSGPGRPFFVMELVKGVPITRFCDAHHLTPRQRLELFVPVCQAIQHAHQKGVIHRDIKPSNVLVALYDDRPVPKVIDFGIAKATGQQLTEQTLQTGFGAVVGTVEYMSPEQANFNQLDVDTRSDIYSLGVLLYELLAGSPPFGRQALEKAGLLGMLQVIREEEPPRPSTRLSTAEGLPTLAANRGTEAKRLTALLRGEIDWIVMKCLDKDRTRRYGTANGLAEDIQRYLTDDPVQAGPPRASYRLRKFARRNRGVLLGAALVFLTLLVGMGGTSWGLAQAWQQQSLTELARQDETEQRLAAVANAARAVDEEEKAKTARDEAEQLAKEAKAARDRAETQLLRAEGLLYASQINLAQQAWESNKASLAQHHLTSCRRDFRGWEHDFLARLFNGNQQTFRPHKREVTCVALSPDGKSIVSASVDGMVKIWDAASGIVTRTITGPNGPGYGPSPISSVALSDDGKLLVTGSWDNTVRLWDAASGKRLQTCKGHTHWVTSVALSPDGKRLVSGSMDGTVKVWDPATGQNTLTLKGSTKAVYSVAVSLDGKQIVSGNLEGLVEMWDAATGQKTRTLKGHTSEVMSVVLTPDGKQIVSGSADKTLKVWDAATGQDTRTLKGHAGRVMTAAVGSDGKQIVSGSWDGTVKIWDIVTGEEIRCFRGHLGEVASVALSRDGQRIVSGSHDTTVKVWNAAASQEPRTLKGHKGGVYCVAVSSDALLLVSGGQDQTVKIWNVASGQETRTLKGHTREVVGVALTPDGKQIVSGSWDRTVKVWDTATGKETRTLKGHTSEVVSVALTPDGKQILSGSVDGTVKFWDLATGQETLSITGPIREVASVALSPDGKRLVSGNHKGIAAVWDPAPGREALTLKGHAQVVNRVTFSPDARKIVTGSGDKTVRVWDATTGQATLTLQGHTADVYSVAVSPDATRIISAGQDQTVKLWNAHTGQETITLLGHSHLIWCLALTPDGKRLVSGSVDGTVKVWDASQP